MLKCKCYFYMVIKLFAEINYTSLNATISSQLSIGVYQILSYDQ